MKLDIFILQKQILSSSENQFFGHITNDNDEIYCLKRKLLDERVKNKLLERHITFVVERRNNEVNDLTRIICSLEDKRR